jgi:hypothetical protein
VVNACSAVATHGALVYPGASRLAFLSAHLRRKNEAMKLPASGGTSRLKPDKRQIFLIPLSALPEAASVIHRERTADTHMEVD